MRPVSASASAAARSASANFRTSVTQGIARPPPRALTSAAFASKTVALMSHMTTFAPRRASSCAAA